MAFYSYSSIYNTKPINNKSSENPIITSGIHSGVLGNASKKNVYGCIIGGSGCVSSSYGYLKSINQNLGNINNDCPYINYTNIYPFQDNTNNSSKCIFDDNSSKCIFDDNSSSICVGSIDPNSLLGVNRIPSGSANISGILSSEDPEDSTENYNEQEYNKERYNYININVKTSSSKLFNFRHTKRHVNCCEYRNSYLDNSIPDYLSKLFGKLCIISNYFMDNNYPVEMGELIIRNILLYEDGTYNNIEYIYKHFYFNTINIKYHPLHNPFSVHSPSNHIYINPFIPFKGYESTINFYEDIFNNTSVDVFDNENGNKPSEVINDRIIKNGYIDNFIIYLGIIKIVNIINKSICSMTSCHYEKLSMLSKKIRMNEPLLIYKIDNENYIDFVTMNFMRYNIISNTLESTL